jgi:hypothetical protein
MSFRSTIIRNDCSIPEVDDCPEKHRREAICECTVICPLLLPVTDGSFSTMSHSGCPNQDPYARVISLDDYPNVFEKQLADIIAGRMANLLTRTAPGHPSLPKDPPTIEAIEHDSRALPLKKVIVSGENSPPGRISSS